MSRKKLLAAFIEEVWSQGRIEACDDFIGETYTVRHDPHDPWDGQTLSRDGFKERVRLSREPLPDQRFTLVSMLEDGDAIATAWTWAATHTSDVAGFAPTGARLIMSGLTIYDFDGQDRIRGHWQAVDRLGVYQQLTRNAV
ncbi:MAG TPA: ester cyclase [Rhizomicrobium sp.]|jgi:predicted ester cyclase|nr:ester cyclase [Rhizomicrobium sp.]